MKKILLKRIGLILCILSIFLLVVLSGIVFFTESKIAKHNLEEITNHFEDLYKKSKLDLEVTEKNFEEDYLNRAYAVDFMLHNYEGKYNISTLNKIKELLEVESINIVADTGEIILSSEKESIGLNLKDHQKFEAFVKLINSNDAKANVVQLDGVSITGKEPKTYIGVKSSSEEYSLIQIGLDGDVFEELIARNCISSIIKNMPNVHENEIFVINRNNGEIDAISSNNKQKLNIDNVSLNERDISLLDTYNEVKLTKFNGSLKLLKTQSIDDKIIGAFMDADVLFRSVLLQIMCLFLGVLIILICIFMIFRYNLKRYVLKDLSSIEATIKELMAGNKDVTFETEHNTEFRYITASLNEWKDVYKYKSERMSRIISSIDSQVAVFECIYSINQNFFSDNIRAILGVDHDEWNEIIKTPKGFETYLKSLMSHPDEEITALKNNRFISVVSFYNENEFYGMIMDKTKDVKVKNKIQQELHAAQKEAEIDQLTNLLNRAGLEKHVKQSLENEPGKGIMIMFDLDNFKSVNDELGHPEGDIVLKKLAHCLKSCFRKNDVVARMGGDEFVVFVHSNIDVNVLADKLQSLLDDVRKDLSVYNERFGLSTSIGAAYVDKQTNSYEDLYKCADVGLYIAKRLGKDRFYINEDNIRCM